MQTIWSIFKVQRKIFANLDQEKEYRKIDYSRGCERTNNVECEKSKY